MKNKNFLFNPKILVVTLLFIGLLSVAMPAIKVNRASAMYCAPNLESTFINPAGQCMELWGDCNGEWTVIVASALCGASSDFSQGSLSNLENSFMIYFAKVFKTATNGLGTTKQIQ